MQSALTTRTGSESEPGGPAPSSSCRTSIHVLRRAAQPDPPRQATSRSGAASTERGAPLAAWPQVVKAQAEPHRRLDDDGTREAIRIADTWGELPLKGVPGDKLPSVLDEAQRWGSSPPRSLSVLYAPDGRARRSSLAGSEVPDRSERHGRSARARLASRKGALQQSTVSSRSGTVTASPTSTRSRTRARPPLASGRRQNALPLQHRVRSVREGRKLFYGPLMKACRRGTSGVTDKRSRKPIRSRAKIFRASVRAAPVEQPDAEVRPLAHHGPHPRALAQARDDAPRAGTWHRAAPEALLYMNPQDAEKRGMKRGDLAEVSSRYGTCRAKVGTRSARRYPRAASDGLLRRARHGSTAS